VSIVHVMGGLAGYIGTWMIGPRVGLYYDDKKLIYILDDDILYKKLTQEKEQLQEE
jgi:ammonia channel protein AmtB